MAKQIKPIPSLEGIDAERFIKKAESTSPNQIDFSDQVEDCKAIIDKSKWVSVKNDLPDWDIPVLLCMSSGIMFFADIDHDNDWENFRDIIEIESDHNDKIIYWMHLPEMPNN